MTIIDSLNLSQNPEWPTPQYVFDALDREFHFTLDVCANEDNHKCTRYFDDNTDGLKHDWGGGGLLDESPVREADKQVGTESVGIRTARRGHHRSRTATQPYGHKMVLGCNESVGDSHCPREVSVRRRIMHRTVRVYHRGMGNTPYPEDRLYHF